MIYYYQCSYCETQWASNLPSALCPHCGGAQLLPDELVSKRKVIDRYADEHMGDVSDPAFTPHQEDAL